MAVKLNCVGISKNSLDKKRICTKFFHGKDVEKIYKTIGKGGKCYICIPIYMGL